MREIDLDEPVDRLPSDTFLIYGDTGQGKTTLSAGFPRPLILADESEAGWKAIRGLTDDLLFEPGLKPMIWGISGMGDMATALERIPPLIASGRVMTVVVSSITFYAQTYLTHLSGTVNDPRQIYGKLGEHLRWLRTGYHSLGVNVVWEALESRPEDAVKDKLGNIVKDAQPGGPMIAGQQAGIIAASVTYLWRCTLDVLKKDGQIFDHVAKLRTKALGGYVGRSRIGPGWPQLPSPLLGGYKGFLAASGFDVERIQQGLPPIKTAVSTPPKPAAPKVVTRPAVTSLAPKVASPPSGAQATTNPSKK